ncbi:MAG: hypothetical protein LBP59_16325 [Planctomycetaceae bacterium]|nr:hypothetical protein [Planctomycetaceae bacterium]
MRLYSTANERGLDLNRLFVCLSAKCRRDARDPLVSPAFWDRGRLACMRLYSTANERGLDRKRLFVCLSAKCRRDARDPLVSPAFRNRRYFRIANISPGVSSDSQAERLHPRIAGVSPACGCIQPPMREV